MDNSTVIRIENETKEKIDSLKIHPKQSYNEVILKGIESLETERKIIEISKQLKSFRVVHGSSGTKVCFFCGQYKCLLLMGAQTQEQLRVFESTEGCFICENCLKKGLEIFNNCKEKR